MHMLILARGVIGTTSAYYVCCSLRSVGISLKPSRSMQVQNIGAAPLIMKLNRTRFHSIGAANKLQVFRSQAQIERGVQFKFNPSHRLID